MISAKSKDKENKLHFYCSAKNQARLVCMNFNCNDDQIYKINSFVCSKDECSVCSKHHLNCKLFKIHALHEQILHKKAKTNKNNQKSFKALEKVYDQSIDRIKKDKRQLLTSTKANMGLNKYDIQFLRLIKQGKLKQITGKKITFNVRKHIHEKVNFQASQNDVLRYKVNVQKTFNEIFNILQQMKSQAVVIQTSKIISQMGMLSQFFFPKKIKNLNLLYRGSQNKFSAKSFHKKCDNIYQTLSLIQTNQGSILGGYTPLCWDKSNKYKADTEKKTFIFSISLGQKYELFDVENAIYCHQNYGPTFGTGHDINIRNGKDGHGCNFPVSYFHCGSSGYGNLSGLLIGKGNHIKNFNLKQYQVFQVQFIGDKKAQKKGFSSYLKGAANSVTSMASWVMKMF